MPTWQYVHAFLYLNEGIVFDEDMMFVFCFVCIGKKIPTFFKK